MEENGDLSFIENHNIPAMVMGHIVDGRKDDGRKVVNLFRLLDISSCFALLSVNRQA